MDSSAQQPSVRKGARRAANATRVAAGGRFPKQSHLLRRAEFDRVYKGGRRLSFADMNVMWLRRDAATDKDAAAGVAEANRNASPRVGFTVGRVLGNAVARNRLRRRLREAVRLNLSTLREPVDIVVHPRKSAVAVSFEDLLQQVSEALRSIQQGKGSRAKKL